MPGSHIREKKQFRPSYIYIICDTHMISSKAEGAVNFIYIYISQHIFIRTSYIFHLYMEYNINKG